MRLILIGLVTLLLLIQYPLWLGKGGWLRVWELNNQVALAKKKNVELKARNAKLNSEVEDLRQGTGAVEERARFELGMIKDDEIFIQVLDSRARAESPGLSVATPVMTPAPAAAISSAKPVPPSVAPKLPVRKPVAPAAVEPKSQSSSKPVPKKAVASRTASTKQPIKHPIKQPPAANKSKAPNP